MGNITIQLDDETIHSAKVLAAKKGTSVSALVAQMLREATVADARYRQAMDVAFASMAEAAHSGRRAPAWTRDEINDRVRR
jgi:plasmid stability protein